MSDAIVHELTAPTTRVHTIRCACGKRFRSPSNALTHAEVANSPQRTEGWGDRELATRAWLYRAMGDDDTADLQMGPLMIGPLRVWSQPNGDIVLAGLAGFVPVARNRPGARERCEALLAKPGTWSYESLWPIREAVVLMDREGRR